MCVCLTCVQIHKSLRDLFKVALVWGQSTKHNPQHCGLKHVLRDEDVIQVGDALCFCAVSTQPACTGPASTTFPPLCLVFLFAFCQLRHG